ncbi:MAG: UDP-N-acetylmuramate dehydrogenase [Kistimonas sp.]|nr:UDP-N-acetylmuramate dehydrogenase [Kistimonas sp.]
MTAVIACHGDRVPGLRRDQDLTRFNTLGLPARAAWFAQAYTQEQLSVLLAWASERGLPVLPIGEGSNLVLHSRYPGLVVRIRLRGRRVQAAPPAGDSVLVTAAAGENWDDFVRWTLVQGYSGLENLSLIPGCVGGAPVQNVGAYGMEIARVLHQLTALDLQGTELRLQAEDCQFAYRDSLFKRLAGASPVITRVTFRLSRRFVPCLDYAPLRAAVENNYAAPDSVSAHQVRALVCDLRRNRLPDPAHLANAGSFFGNPVVTAQEHACLVRDHPGIVAFPVAGQRWKLAAAWLVEACGFKGVRESSGAGVYHRHALVLVNHGGANGESILSLAARIQKAVHQRFGVQLQIEPRVS